MQNQTNQNHTKSEQSFADLTDEELAVRANRSAAAMETLIARYSRTVRICARPLFLAGGDQEDLFQEGMIGLLYALRSYDPSSGTPFRAYALVCIRNKLISAVRAAAANKHAPLNDSVSFHTFSQDDTVPESMRADPEAEVIGRVGAGEFLDALCFLLSTTEKAVLSLYLQGLSYSEIAAACGKTNKAVDNTVQRIRRKAIKILGENGQTV
jgi:RNA polymerase sporulation-specific sigma factor